MPGEGVDLAKSDQPNPNFEPFYNAMLKQVGMAINVPYEILIQHFQSSYSAARGVILEAWRHFRIDTERYANHCYQIAFEAVISECVSKKLIKLPGFFKSAELRSAYLGATWTGQATPRS